MFALTLLCKIVLSPTSQKYKIIDRDTRWELLPSLWIWVVLTDVPTAAITDPAATLHKYKERHHWTNQLWLWLLICINSFNNSSFLLAQKADSDSLCLFQRAILTSEEEEDFQVGLVELVVRALSTVTEFNLIWESICCCLKRFTWLTGYWLCFMNTVSLEF